jgi:dTDP-4-dehydrorhamnose 3,5-epimerase-like enzyme
VARPAPLALAGLRELPGNPDGERQITFVELGAEPAVSAPFAVQRVYWIHGLRAGDRRGEHAHRQMQQLLVAAHGRLRVELDDGHARRPFVLDRPTVALWVPPGLWRRIEVLSDGATLLALASTHFEEADYIRDYDEFLAYAGAGPSA